MPRRCSGRPFASHLEGSTDDEQDDACDIGAPERVNRSRAEARAIRAVAIVSLASTCSPAASDAFAAPARDVVAVKTVRVTAPGNPRSRCPVQRRYLRDLRGCPGDAAGLSDGWRRRSSLRPLAGGGHRWALGHLPQHRRSVGKRPEPPLQPDAVWSAVAEVRAVNFDASTQSGRHYSVASPEWTDKPFAFANFLRAARFANSLYNGDVLSKREGTGAGFDTVAIGFKLPTDEVLGMYDLSRRRATRTSASGFVIPSQDEWIKAAYFDPSGGGEVLLTGSTRRTPACSATATQPPRTPPRSTPRRAT